MTVAAMMVYVDPAQQTEQQVRVAREMAIKCGAPIIGASALMVPPLLVADGVVIHVAKYLLRVAKCRTDVRVHTAESVSDHLLRLATGLNAVLIVTGAYRHSRLGEWLFDGMTRGLLKDMRCCLMMSH